MTSQRSNGSETAGGPLTDVDIETRAVLTRDQLAAY